MSAIKKIAIYIFPIFTVIFVCFYLVNEPLYRKIISEDHVAEWLTFLFLWIAGIFSLLLWYNIKKTDNYHNLFFILFGAFALLAGLEEISWGQRVFKIETTEFFDKYNDQKETNLHNTFQGVFHIKTKHIALISMFIYGVILPWLKRKNKLDNRLFNTNWAIIPPYFLLTGFIFATIMMLDFQTGYEEEIGELYFSLCFCIMLYWEYLIFKNRGAVVH